MSVSRRRTPTRYAGYASRQLYTIYPNFYSRMCNLAGPGEILVSGFVPHLSGKLPGLAYECRGLVQLKGFDDPITVVQVVEAPA